MEWNDFIWKQDWNWSQFKNLTWKYRQRFPKYISIKNPERRIGSMDVFMEFFSRQNGSWTHFLDLRYLLIKLVGNTEIETRLPRQASVEHIQSFRVGVKWQLESMARRSERQRQRMKRRYAMMQISAERPIQELGPFLTDVGGTMLGDQNRN